MYGEGSQMGKFMNNFTLYNEDGNNANDDAPDSLAMFSREIICGGSLPIKVRAIKRPFQIFYIYKSILFTEGGDYTPEIAKRNS